MERSKIELDVEELKKAAGGIGENPSHDESFNKMKKFVDLCLGFKRSYADAIRLTVLAYRKELPEDEIREYVRLAYGM